MIKKKFFGQHFLRDESVVEAIIEAANLDSSVSVLEIGPGDGALTARLVERALRVVSIDIDADAIDATRKNVQSDKLELIEQDVLAFKDEDIKRLFHDEPYTLIGNLPYNITSKILQKFIGISHKPDVAIIMVQKEVADRLSAKRGDMSLLGLVVQLSATVRHVINVPRDAFSPPPKVDSAVVKLDFNTEEDNHARGVKDVEKIIRFAKVAFASKRKQMRSTIGSLPDINVDALESALKKLGFPPTARPEELSVGDWIAFYNLLHQNCV